MNRSEINAILASAGLRPQHKFGQNFMVDQATLGRIADAGDIGPHDVILEVGPGVGNLTRLLAQRAAAVLAVDIDAPLLQAAQQHSRSAGATNITWLQQDVLAGKHQVSPVVLDALQHLKAQVGSHGQAESHGQMESLGQAGCHGSTAPFAGAQCPTPHTARIKLVSNLPYNVASPLIAELLVQMWRERRAAHGLWLERMAFTVQWEVAQRMAAQPNTRDYGPLGILIGLLADVEIMRKIPPGAFWPPPKVHSALVRVLPRRERFDAIANAPRLQELLAGVFGHRRQRLSNALDHWLKDSAPPDLLARLKSAGIDTTARPENLLPPQFLALAEVCTGC